MSNQFNLSSGTKLINFRPFDKLKVNDLEAYKALLLKRTTAKIEKRNKMKVDQPEEFRIRSLKQQTDKTAKKRRMKANEPDAYRTYYAKTQSVENALRAKTKQGPVAYRAKLDHDNEMDKARQDRLKVENPRSIWPT